MIQVSPKGVVFDLDGTLIDSIPDVVCSINRLLAEERRRELLPAEARMMVGEGATSMIERAFAATGHAVRGAALAALTDRYLAIYRCFPVIHTKPYPGVGNVLKEFQDAGIVMGVCTNNPHEISVLVLEQLGMLELFAAVIGGDALAVKKPDAGHVRAVLDAMGTTTNTAIYVGDSSTDVTAARNAAMPVIAVSYGYSRTAPEALGADILIDRFDELPGAIARLTDLHCTATTAPYG